MRTRSNVKRRPPLASSRSASYSAKVAEDAAILCAASYKVEVQKSVSRVTACCSVLDDTAAPPTPGRTRVRLCSN